MKKVCILFPEREISLVTPQAPVVARRFDGRIRTLCNVGQSAANFLLYVDWDKVQAILVYDVEEGEDHGTQTS